MKSIKPRVIVITGAAAGVGRATAKMFAETEGAHIGLIARGMEALEGAKRDVEALGGKAIIIQCDVTDAEGIEAAAERVERELGPIDVWVNVAMTSVFAYVKKNDSSRVQARDRGLLSWLRQRHVGRLEADASPEPRPHHSGGQRVGLSRNPAASGVLRQQTRDPRVHGFPARGVNPR